MVTAKAATVPRHCSMDHWGLSLLLHNMQDATVVNTKQSGFVFAVYSCSPPPIIQSVLSQTFLVNVCIICMHIFLHLRFFTIHMYHGVFVYLSRTYHSPIMVPLNSIGVAQTFVGVLLECEVVVYRLTGEDAGTALRLNSIFFEKKTEADAGEVSRMQYSLVHCAIMRKWILLSPVTPPTRGVHRTHTPCECLQDRVL